MIMDVVSGNKRAFSCNSTRAAVLVFPPVHEKKRDGRSRPFNASRPHRVDAARGGYYSE